MQSSLSPAAAGHGILPSFSPIRPTLPLDRRGSLRNGNRAGDFLAAPRCNACTRAHGACRQPAMANGRCRFHGGLSTGPRTAEGRARCARARRTHGAYSREILELRRAARAHGRRVRSLLAQMRGRGPAPAGHGVLPSKSIVGARCARPSLSGATPLPMKTQLDDPRARAARPYTSDTTISAGHLPAVRLRQAGGVLPSFSRVGAFLRGIFGLGTRRVAPARPRPYVPGAPPVR